MRKIGNIVTDSGFMDDGLFNVVWSVDLTISGVPTLIVGWKKAEGIYPDLDILDWHIRDNVYWTFGKRERNWCYEDNVINFRKLCLDYIARNIRYEFFNVLTAAKEEKNNLVEWIMEPNHKKYAYFRNDMAYIYIEKQNVIYGLSLRDIEYAGGKYERFTGMLKASKTVAMVKPGNESFDLQELIRVKPYLVSYLYSE